MQWILSLFLLVLMSNARIYEFPNLSAEDAKTKVVLEKNLSEDTIIRHPKFKITAPKGWTIEPQGPNGKHFVSVVIIPNPDVTLYETTISLHLESEKTNSTLQQAHEHQAKKGADPHWKRWKNREWLVYSGSSKGPSGPITVWNALTLLDSKVVRFIGFTTTTKRENYEAIILKTMESVELFKGK